MPVYEFCCTKCDTSFEVVLPMSDYEKPTLEPCKNCGNISIEQKVSASALIDSVRLGIRKPDRTFQREVLGRMAKNIPHNKIGQGRYAIPGRV